MPSPVAVRRPARAPGSAAVLAPAAAALLPAVAALLAGAVLLAAPAAAAAQEPVSSFDQLNLRLEPGDTVWVTDADGREVKGKVIDLRGTEITLGNGALTTIQADRVRLVQRRTKSVGRTATMGAFLLGGLGVLAMTGEGSCDGSTCGSYALLIGGAVGAGAGALLGAGLGVALPARRRDVYRAPTAPGPGRGARLSLSPVVAPRARGVAVSFAF